MYSELTGELQKHMFKCLHCSHEKQKYMMIPSSSWRPGGYIPYSVSFMIIQFRAVCDECLTSQTRGLPKSEYLMHISEFRAKLADILSASNPPPNYQDKENPQLTLLHKISPSNPRCTGVPLTHQRLIPLKRSAISAA